MAEYLIILPPPCTNSDLHMGHLAGVYIPGDVYGRYLASRGHDVKIVCGADQNNTYTELKSKKINQSFDYTKDLYAHRIRKSLDDSKVLYQSFPFTASKNHRQVTQQIINRLLKNNFLNAEKVEQLYCEKCEKYIFDTTVQGKCGSCYSIADGGLCENCVSPVFNNKLIGAIHRECGSNAVLKLTKAFTLNIKSIQNNFKYFIEHSMWDDRIKLKYSEYLSREVIENIILTYHYEHGIEVEQNSVEAKAITIWFEAIWSCFTALIEIYGTDLEDLIKKLNDPQTHLIPFMGQDTEFYYAITVSAVLLGLGVNKVPHKMSIQRFVKLNGMKFSSSRNHVITIDQLKEKYPVDIIRFYSISILKSYFEDSNDFDINDLDRFYNKFKTLHAKLYSHFQHWNNKKATFNLPEELLKRIDNYHAAMKKLDFSKVYEEIDPLIPIVTSQDSESALNVEIACYLLMIKPIMPDIAGTLGVDFYGDQWTELSLDSISRKSVFPTFTASANSIAI